jgi:hypothetical protein
MKNYKKTLFFLGCLLISLTSCVIDKNSCKQKNKVKKNELRYFANIALWNINTNNITISINNQIIYTHDKVSTNNDHAKCVIHFYKKDGLIYAQSDTTISVPEYFILRTKIKKNERQDTINLSETKRILLTYLEDETLGLILIQKFSSYNN